MLGDLNSSLVTQTASNTWLLYSLVLTYSGLASASWYIQQYSRDSNTPVKNRGVSNVDENKYYSVVKCKQ